MEGDPQNALLRRNIIDTHYRLGTAYHRLGQPQAAEHYAKALELRRELVEENPSSVSKHCGLILALGRCGKCLQAAEIADSLLAEDPQDAHVLYLLATGYAVSAEAVAQVEDDVPEKAELLERYTAAAIDTLRSAIDHGYQAPAELRLDPDLDGIRDRAEFQELLDAVAPPDDLPPGQD